MSNVLHTFDINKFIVTLGPARISGFVPGTFIEIEYDDAFYKTQQGIDGEVCRIRNNKFMATITMTLQQSSRANDELSGILLSDLAGNLSLPLVIKDLSGSTVAVASEAWIEKFAPASFGEESQERKWTIKAAKLDAFIGGNNT
jgi:hypothetical protein